MEQSAFAVRSLVMDPARSSASMYRSSSAIFQASSPLMAVTWLDAHTVAIAAVGPVHTVQIWTCTGDMERGTWGEDFTGTEQSGLMLRMTYYEHSNEITALSWSPTGTLVASASEDGTIRVWNVQSGVTILLLPATRVVRTLAWSPDECCLAIGCDDNSIRVCNISAACICASYSGHCGGRYGIDALSWSPDGRHIASAGDDATVQIWHATTGQHELTYRGHCGQWALVVSWSPDGCWIASGGDDVHVWSTCSGQRQQVYSAHEYTQNWIDGLSWSPDGQWIASSSTDRTLHIWQAHTATTIRTHIHPASGEPCYGLKANALAWSPEYLHATSYEHMYCLAFASCDKTVSLVRLLIEE